MIAVLVIAAGITALAALGDLVWNLRRSGRLSLVHGAACVSLALSVVAMCAGGLALAS